MTDTSPKNAGSDREVESFHHDLRTQLSAIASLTHLIRKSGNVSDNAALFEALELAANNAIALVEDGVRFHKAPPTQAMKLTDLLQDFGRLAQGWAEARGASFALRLDEALRKRPFASPDPVYFHRLFTLLLDNALKYAPGADIELSASIKRGTELAIRFADNGPGFGTADPSLLFEPYHRGKEGEKVSGTGMGLWSVKNIVTMMNGRIWATSNEPTGAVFHMRLPLAISNAALKPQSDEQQKLSEDIDDDVTLSHHGLIVDDNETNRLILGELLKAMDCSAGHAKSVKAALEWMASSRPEFVLSDIRMADMDGWALAETIRDNSAWDQIPVIAVSSDPVPFELEPFDGWLQRPVDPQTLQGLLADLLVGKP